MSRRAAREAAMRLLYEYSIKNELSNDSMYDMQDVFHVEKLSDDNIAYVENVVQEFLSHKEDIDEYITRNSNSWSLDRISKVDLSILRLALFEIFYSEVPQSIICDEALEIAKKYSSEKSASFINGVLGGVIKELDA